MRSFRARARFAAVGLMLAGGLTLSACGSDGSGRATAPPPSDTTSTGATFELGKLVTSLAFANVNTIAGVRAQMSIPTGLAEPPFDASLCTFSVSTQFFACPPINIASMTFTTRYSASDPTGAVLSRLNGGNVARMHFVRTAKGNVVLAVRDGAVTNVVVSDSSDVTATGLTTSAATLNGSTKAHYEVSNQGGVLNTSVFDFTTTVTGVVLPTAGAAPLYPASGSVTAEMHGQSVNGVHTNPLIDMHAVLTYNGTSKATLVTTAASQTLTCQVDLSGLLGPACK